MHVTVRVFAMLRERAGAGSVDLELPDGASVADALAELGPLTDGLPLVMAVNREYAPEDQLLGEGDELALIPPVSGGSGERWARVTSEPLSLSEVAGRVRDPRAGAVVTFSGVTRDVEKLEYEAYAEMAAEKLQVIVDEAFERHGLCSAAVEHRVGDVPLSEPSVVVAASAPHRGRGLRGRARDHRPGEGRGSDLEARGRGRRGALGGGRPADPLGPLEEALRGHERRQRRQRAGHQPDRSRRAEDRDRVARGEVDPHETHRARR